MSATAMTFTMGYTVRDSEALPDGMDADDVAEELGAVIEGAVMEWYGRRGEALLVCEPT